jgi:hypothetical protein
MQNFTLDNFIKKIDADDTLFNNFVAAVRGGNNSIFHNVVSHAIMLDDNWILTIESALYSIEHIVRNPRKFIAENELIVDVARVRRTNAKTVRHLSSHSQYVQNVSPNGDITPKKLLTVEFEEELAIYENKFICALINRLILFVEQRYKDLQGKLDVYEQTNVKMQSEFNYGESKFKCEISLNVQEPPEDKTRVTKNKDLYERVNVIRRRLRVLQSTDFMKVLSSQKPVRPPIQKTNLLTKNIDYNNCYKLWLYISSFTYLGYSIEIKDKNLPVDSDYYDDLAIVAGLGARSLLRDNVLKKEKYEAIDYSVPQEKDYTLVNNMSYTPSFDSSKAKAGEEAINEYYFRKIKDELVKLAGENEIAIDEELAVNFPKFYRGVARVNDELFNELIEQSLAEKETKEILTPVQKKQAQIKLQQERVKRRNLLLKLKWEELEKAQRVQERAIAKLEKLKQELEKEKQKAKSKKVKKTTLKSKTKLLNINADGTK